MIMVDEKRPVRLSPLAPVTAASLPMHGLGGPVVVAAGLGRRFGATPAV